MMQRKANVDYLLAQYAVLQIKGRTSSIKLAPLHTQQVKCNYHFRQVWMDASSVLIRVLRTSLRQPMKLLLTGEPGRSAVLGLPPT